MAKDLKFEKFSRGIEVAVDGKDVYVKMDTTAKREPSSTGKMDLTASTSGFKDVEGTKGFRLMINGGFKN